MVFTTHFRQQSQTTWLLESVSHRREHWTINGILTLYDAPFQRTYIQVSPENASLNYNSAHLTMRDFKFEQFPLHSPLLGESLLVSFPPLIDMLKFSGFSCQFQTKLTESTPKESCFLCGYWMTSWNQSWLQLNSIRKICCCFIDNQHSDCSTYNHLQTIAGVYKWSRLLPAQACRTNAGHQSRRGFKWFWNGHASRDSRKRNVHSKIRWFTEFCNSHYLSHFAAFFIVARAKRSVAKSFIVCLIQSNLLDRRLKQWVRQWLAGCPRPGPEKNQADRAMHPIFANQAALPQPPETYSAQKVIDFSQVLIQRQAPAKIVNDPTAGSPTVTLLRLLLPLNDQVCPTSQELSAVAGTESPIRRAH